MKKLFIVVFLFMTSFSFAQSPDNNKWTTQDTLLQLSFISDATIDWLQSRSSLRRTETNPIFREDHPSKQKFDRYCSTGIILHTGISILLPKPYRTIWQCFWTGVEANAAFKNYNMGIKIKF
jgi:hypothetical protein